MLLVLALFQAGCATGAKQTKSHPFPGIVCYTETRQNPPMRLFVAKIDLTNPKVRLRVAPGGPDPDGPGPWQTTLMEPTRIAAREGFDLVVNGDFFDAKGIKDAEGTNSHYRAAVWGAVNGPAVTDGNAWSASTNAWPCLVVHKDGKVTIEPLARASADAWEVVAGNTLLLENGTRVPHKSIRRHPRTVAGLNAKGTKLILMVVDGRKPKVSIGMSYDELATELLRLGCHDALNLDGGGSSVMALRDPSTGGFRILNQPTDGHERAVANALGVSVAP
jgi:exopolysaccharide biosynthesis protein